MTEITREQLELAALAAGHTEARYEDWPGMAVRHGYVCGIWTGDCYINPAESIADAARLAVRLGLNITMPRHRGDGVAAEGPSGVGSITVYRDSAELAYCHAITLCAAEIGRQMKGGA